MMPGPKHPEISVQLTGRDGNAFFILGRIRDAMRRGGVPDTEIEQFTEEATGSDYDNLLATCMKWVDVR